MLDYTVFHKISYGLYLVSSGNNTEGNGYISNTVFQVTSEPVQFATCCNKENHTARLIQKSGAFAASILHQQTSPEIYGTFGYKSGRDTNKLEGIKLKYGESGVPIVLNDAVAYIECKLVNTIDLGTHLMFIGEVIQSELLDDSKEVLTYDFYRKVKKGLAPKNAPTYINPLNLKNKMTTEKTKSRHQCIVCGYVYDEAEENIPFDELDDDWTCPACGAGKSDFIT